MYFRTLWKTIPLFTLILFDAFAANAEDIYAKFDFASYEIAREEALPYIRQIKALEKKLKHDPESLLLYELYDLPGDKVKGALIWLHYYTYKNLIDTRFLYAYGFNLARSGDYAGAVIPILAGKLITRVSGVRCKDNTSLGTFIEQFEKRFDPIVSLFPQQKNETKEYILKAVLDIEQKFYKRNKLEHWICRWGEDYFHAYIANKKKCIARTYKVQNIQEVRYECPEYEVVFVPDPTWEKGRKKILKSFKKACRATLFLF